MRQRYQWKSSFKSSEPNNNLYIFNESMFLKFHISSPLFCFPSFRNTVINTDQQLIQKKYVWQLATAAKSGSVTLLAFTYSFKIPYAANIQLDLCKAVCSCWAVCCSCLILHICSLTREQNLFINSFLFLLSLDFSGMFPGSIRHLKINHFVKHTDDLNHSHCLNAWL